MTAIDRRRPRDPSTRITSFSGAHACLSNFHPSCLEWMGLAVPTLEHGFQLAKTRDQMARLRIASAPTPGAAKRLGRDVPLRPGWEEAKKGVMRALLIQKFTRHADLARVLLATGDAELVEGNSWGDVYWGVSGGHGQNMLGQQLMEVRALLRSIAG
jgi:ribA/ribD-fused uncharacterized protein